MKHPLLSQVRKARWTMFNQLDDNENARNGQRASRQTVYYRVVGWPPAQESMHRRAHAIRDTARKWPTTFKELQSSALPGEPENTASVINRFHDVLRGWTIQVSVAHEYKQKDLRTRTAFIFSGSRSVTGVVFRHRTGNANFPV